MTSAPKQIYRADYHCKLLKRNTTNEVVGTIIDDEQCRYFETMKSLRSSIRNTRDMKVSRLRITKYNITK